MGTLEMSSTEKEYFVNREEAGKSLAGALEPYRGENPVVVGIPRGGIVIAREIANRLDGDLDFVLSHKLRAPFSPELAIGAVNEKGRLFLEGAVSSGSIDLGYLEEERRYQMKRMAERTKNFRAILPKLPWKRRTVILTDDGIATGFTTEAALWTVRQENPRRLILAIPVGEREIVKELSKQADRTLCLCVPKFFGAVSQFYLDFPPVEEQEVEAILRTAWMKRKRG